MLNRLRNFLKRKDDKVFDIIHSQCVFKCISIKPDFYGLVFLNINTSCPVVGVLAETINGEYLNEIYLNPHKKNAKCWYAVPINTKNIIIRNASDGSFYNDIKVCDTNFFPLYNSKFLKIFSTITDFVFDKYFIIHAFEKTGSITLQKLLNNFSVKSYVSRSHFINAKRMGFIKHQYIDPNFLNQKFIDNMIIQYSNLEYLKKNKINHTIICGLRNPFTTAISYIFQHYGSYFIDNKLSINETLSFVKKQIPTVLNLHELWFMYDFFQLHKIELNDLVYLENINPYIYKLNSKTKNKEIIFYKLEDGVNAFTSVSSYLLNKDINKDSFLKENTSGSKSYNKLYKTVLKKIRKRDFGLKKHSNLYKIFNAFGYDLSIFK